MVLYHESPSLSGLMLWNGTQTNLWSFRSCSKKIFWPSSYLPTPPHFYSFRHCTILSLIPIIFEQADKRWKFHSLKLSPSNSVIYSKKHFFNFLHLKNFLRYLGPFLEINSDPGSVTLSLIPAFHSCLNFTILSISVFWIFKYVPIFNSFHSLTHSQTNVWIYLFQNIDTSFQIHIRAQHIGIFKYIRHTLISTLESWMDIL